MRPSRSKAVIAALFATLTGIGTLAACDDAGSGVDDVSSDIGQADSDDVRPPRDTASGDVARDSQTDARSDVGTDAPDGRLRDSTSDTPTVDASDTDVDAPPPPPHFELSCDAPPPSGVDESVVAAWRDEEATRVPGRSATADVSGLPMYVTGESRVDVDGQGHFTVVGRSVEWLFLTNADVEGYGRGTLALRLGQGDRDSRRRFDRFEVDGLRASWVELQTERPQYPLAPTYVASLEATDDPPPEITTLRDDDWKFWYDESSSMGVDRVGAVEAAAFLDIFVAPDGTETLLSDEVVRVTSADQMYVRMDFEPPLELESDNMDARLVDPDVFGIGGDFGQGRVGVPSLSYSGLPTAFFGVGGELSASADGDVVTPSPFNLTQAIDEAGLLLTSVVELAPTEITVDVEEGGYRVVPVSYREASFEGDAVLKEVAVETNGPEDLLKIPVVPFENRTTRLFDVLVDAGWGAPVLFVPVVVAAPFVFFADVLDCIFFGNCGSGGSVRVEPFLGWIDAGSVHEYEVYVAGSGSPGDQWDVTITYIGENFCPARLQLTVNIHASCVDTAGAEPCLCPEGQMNDGTGCVDASP